MVKIGIIGGSGLDDPSILEDAHDEEVSTPYGAPSSKLKIGKIKDIVNYLDHQFLNKVVSFNPTAENISKYFYDKLKEIVIGKIRVKVFETPDSSITYYE